LSLATSRGLAKRTKLRFETNNMSVRCDTYLQTEEIHYLQQPSK